MVNNNVIFFDKADFLTIDNNSINFLKNCALKASTKRARYCLHNSCEEEIQEMIIALCKDSYVRPHKHINKTESYHIIEGKLVVCFFNDDGNITEKVFLGSFNNSQAFYYRLKQNKWHCILPISNFVLIHEVTKGPYYSSDTIYPSWAPKNEEKEKIINFINAIKK